MPYSGLLESVNLGLTAREKEEFTQFIDFDVPEEDLQEILRRIEEIEPTPLTEPLPQEGQTDSRRHNRLFQNIYSDLFTLYRLSYKIDTLLNTHRDLNKSTLKALKRGVEEVENKIKAYEFIVNNEEGFVDVMRENFTDRDNFVALTDDAAYLYRDTRSGLRYNKDLICGLDETSRALTLSQVGKVAPTHIDIRLTTQLGSGAVLEGNDRFPPSNVAAGYEEQVWSEALLVDEPFTVPMEEDPDFAGEEYGAMAKLQLRFPAAVPLNTLALYPFSDSPYRVVAIAGYESTDHHRRAQAGDADPDYILHHEYGEHDPFYDKQPVTLQLQTRDCHLLEIAINQEHYRHTQYVLKASDKENVELARTLFEHDSPILSLVGEKYLESTLDLDSYNRNRLWKFLRRVGEKMADKLRSRGDEGVIDTVVHAFSSAIPGLQAEKFKKVLQDKTAEPESDEKITVDRYLYQYGAKDVIPSLTKYAEQSMYVSEAHQFSGNTREVALVADDYNPTVDGRPATSIEYYVTNRAEPTGADWYPILPEGHDTTVRGERLYSTQDDTQDIDHFTAELRFPADYDEGVAVYRDGDRIPDGDVTLHTEGGAVTEVTVHGDEWLYGSAHIYTADYEVDTAASDPYVVNFSEVAAPVEFIDEDGTSGETFTAGTGKNQTLELSYYPYVDYAQVVDSEVPEREDYPDNPKEGSYSPNYRDGGSGYLPLEVSFEGDYEYYDAETGEHIQTGEVEQDTLGVPYSYKMVDEDHNVVEITRDDDRPYFKNVTDYVARRHPALQDYDPVEYPVFEYLHMGRRLAVNDTFNDKGTANEGEITIRYRYLVDGVRLKIVMRRNVHESSGLTPIVYSYALKTRNAQF